MFIWEVADHCCFPDQETWAITPTSLLKKNLTYSSVFKTYFMKSFAATKASLIFMKNRCRSSRSQMFFKISILKNFAMFTGKHLCWSLFLIKLQAFRFFLVNIAELLRTTFFYRTPPVAASADVLFYIIFSKRRCRIYCSFTLHNCFILKRKITLICFHSLYHRCHSLYHSLLLDFIHRHSLSFNVTCCCSLSLVELLIVTRCHSLSLAVLLFCLFIND